MREITHIKYETIIESDVDESNIYAFRDKEDIVFLCRKDNQFFWKCLKAVNMVWYAKYETIEKAIEGALFVKDFKERCCGSIMEFGSTKEFITWCAKELECYVMPPSKPEVDYSQPYVKIGEGLQLDYWYSKRNGSCFNVIPATYKGQIKDVEGFGGIDVDKVFIVSFGEFKGNAILKEHCTLIIEKK